MGRDFFETCIIVLTPPEGVILKSNRARTVARPNEIEDELTWELALPSALVGRIDPLPTCMCAQSQPGECAVALAVRAAVTKLVPMANGVKSRQARATAHPFGGGLHPSDRPATFAGPKPARKLWIFSRPDRVTTQTAGSNLPPSAILPSSAPVHGQLRSGPTVLES